MLSRGFRTCADQVITGVFLPNPTEVGLLQSCLLEGERGAVATARWLAQPDPAKAARDLIGGNRLLALLNAARLRHGIQVELQVKATLGAAALYAERRSVAFLQQGSEALDAVEAAAVDYRVGKGLALALGAYGMPWYRHCHDLDILVASETLERATRALRDSGFTPQPQLGDAQTEVLNHASLLPVVLHGGTLHPRECISCEMAGRSRLLPVVSPEALLLEVLTLAAGSRVPRSAVWVADAFMLVRARQLDWARLEAMSADSYFRPLVGPALMLLARDFDLEVPEAILTRLYSYPALSRAATNTLLHALHRSAPKGIDSLIGAVRGPGAWMALARWALSTSHAQSHWSRVPMRIVGAARYFWRKAARSAKPERTSRGKKDGAAP